MGKTRSIPFLPVVLLLAILGACSKSQSGINFSIGEKVFEFDPQKVSQLVISRMDPELRSEDRWQARLVRSSAEDWELQNGADGQTLVDRRANSNYVRHLLDSLQGLRFKAKAPNGPMSSFGLDIPRYALRWTQASGEMEIRFGQIAAEGRGTYAWIKGPSKGEPLIAVVDGSTLPLLKHVDSFQQLRQKQWITFSPDEVDEIELRRGKTTLLYAQRAGDDWTDKRDHRYKIDINAMLKNLAEAEIQDFIDDSGRAAAIRSDLEKGALYEGIFKDRHGNPTTIRLAVPRSDKSKNQLLFVGTISSRPSAVFALPPEVARFFVLNYK